MMRYLAQASMKNQVPPRSCIMLTRFLDLAPVAMQKMTTIIMVCDFPDSNYTCMGGRKCVSLEDWLISTPLLCSALHGTRCYPAANRRILEGVLASRKWNFFYYQLPTDSFIYFSTKATFFAI